MSINEIDFDEDEPEYFECGYCGEEFDSDDERDEHEEECELNPDSKYYEE